jgi:hypothetical protein
MDSQHIFTEYAADGAFHFIAYYQRNTLDRIDESSSVRVYDKFAEGGN